MKDVLIAVVLFCVLAAVTLMYTLVLNLRRELDALKAFVKHHWKP